MLLKDMEAIQCLQEWEKELEREMIYTMKLFESGVIKPGSKV